MESKKNKNIDHYCNRSFLMAIGLLTSTFLVSMTFKIRSSYQPQIITHPEPFESFLPLIPITEFEPPLRKPKPIPKTAPLIITTEPHIIDTKPLLDNLEEVPVNTEEDSRVIEQPEEPTPTSTFLVLEEQASFPGGHQAWMKFLKKNFKYPRMAKRSGIEGKVFLSFYVDQEGNISDVNVIRGIGGGCDEEATRVLTSSPKWNPGRQRGRAVKSAMTLSITFRLK